MAAGLPEKKTHKRNRRIGAAILFLLVGLLASILAANMRQPEPLSQQEVIPAPPPVQKSTPTPAPKAVVAAPVVAKSKPQITTSAPQKQVVAKPKPAKVTAVVAVKAPEKPKPVARKAAPAPQVVNKTEPTPKSSGFRKLDRDGTVLPDDASEWVCVQDRATGLVWEVKTDDNSIRDRDNFFTWYDPATDRNAGNPGARDGGRCKGEADCDTYAYIQAINQKRLCGFADWRLPAKDELLNLVEYNYNSKQTKASIDLNYFPRTEASWYWTASSNPEKPEYAWFVLFRNGVALNALKEQPKHVRLVRGSEAVAEQI